MEQEKQDLCETCGKTDERGVPCSMMFDRTDPRTFVDRCTTYEKNVKKHKALAEKRGPKSVEKPIPDKVEK